MRFQSSITIKGTTILFAILLAASIYPAIKIKQELVVAEGRAMRAGQLLAGAEATNRAVSRAVVPGRQAVMPMADAIAKTVAAIKKEKTSHMITVTNITAGAMARGGDDKTIGDMSSPVQGVPGLKRARVAVKGNYKTFSLLAQYLAAVEAAPVAISGLSVEKNMFELQLDVLGT